MIDKTPKDLYEEGQEKIKEAEALLISSLNELLNNCSPNKKRRIVSYKLIEWMFLIWYKGDKLTEHEKCFLIPRIKSLTGFGEYELIYSESRNGTTETI